jgi:hypothetical protein
MFARGFYGRNEYTWDDLPKNRTTLPSSGEGLQWGQIQRITQKHVPFPDEPFQPRSITVRVRHPKPSRRRKRWESDSNGKQFLMPVAFNPIISVMVDFACTSSHGSMHPYLYLTEGHSLVRAVQTKVGERFFYVDEPYTISDEDLAHLAIGVQGDNTLLQAEYDKARATLEKEMEQQWAQPFSK